MFRNVSYHCLVMAKDGSIHASAFGVGDNCNIFRGQMHFLYNIFIKSANKYQITKWLQMVPGLEQNMALYNVTLALPPIDIYLIFEIYFKCNILWNGLNSGILLTSISLIMDMAGRMPYQQGVLPV